MTDVFVGRMSGPKLALDQIDALLTWIDAQPRRRARRRRIRRAVERGRRAVQRHAARRRARPATRARSFTNNMTVDVGTGGAFQVPSLVGIGKPRAVHARRLRGDAARSLQDPACGGGDKHGNVTQLTSNEISDLVAYLQSILAIAADGA